MPEGSAALKILSLSGAYPNPVEPAAGIFVRARLQALAGHAEVKVLAPVALARRTRRDRLMPQRRDIPFSRTDGLVETFHPRWIYPPGGTWANALLLAGCLLPLIRRLRAHYPFQVLDAHFGYPDGIAAALLAARLDCPFTVTLRGSERLHASSAALRGAMGWALRRADRIIALSGELAEFATALGAAPSRVKIIPNGVDSTTFFPRESAPARAEYGVPEGGKVVLSAGNLIPLKGHQYVVRALAGLRSAGVPAQLWIAGSAGRSTGEYEHELRRIIAESGMSAWVRMLGRVSPDRLAELMCAADVLCLASTSEGCPNVVREAQACGTPVVASRVGAVPELIPSSRYGLIVPRADVPSLTVALQQALSRNWDHAALSAWAHSRSWDQVAREILAEMLDATGLRPAPPRPATAAV